LNRDVPLYKITTKVPRAKSKLFLKVFAQKMYPPHIAQSKTVTGGCNNNSPKIGVGKANMKTKEQGHSGKKSGALYVGNRGKGSREWEGTF